MIDCLTFISPYLVPVIKQIDETVKEYSAQFDLLMAKLKIEVSFTSFQIFLFIFMIAYSF